MRICSRRAQRDDGTFGTFPPESDTKCGEPSCYRCYMQSGYERAYNDNSRLSDITDRWSIAVRMPRGPRLDAPGCLHHVIARGIERCPLLHADEDRQDLITPVAGLAGTPRDHLL